MANPELLATQRRRWPITAGVWFLSVAGAFLVGQELTRKSSGPVSRHEPAAPATPAEMAPVPSETPAPSAAKSSATPATRPASELENLAPGERTRLEALALGRHWFNQRGQKLAELAQDLRNNPSQLEDAEVIKQLSEFVADRGTTQAALELVSEVEHPRALDYLYQVWTGSKDRTEATQLAEALLLAKDMRQRASPALEVALRLREKPTACEEIEQLVQRAAQDGDRRSSMLLVATSARRDCGAQNQDSCKDCIKNPKDLRAAIQATAEREQPIP